MKHFSGERKVRPMVTNLVSRLAINFLRLKDGSTAVLGNLTLYMPGQDEHIISMEKFLPLTKSVYCDQNGISMTFSDNATFEEAKQVWDWANGAENRSFVIVAGAGDCGWNENRQPFIIQTLDFDGGNVVKLNGGPASWQDVAHSFDLVVGHITLNETQYRRAKRDYTKDISIPMELNFPFSVGISEDGVSSTLSCVDCGTNGHFNLELVISTWWKIPTGASIKLSPSGIEATAKLEWTLSGELSGSINKEWNPVSFPTPATIEIPEVLTIGPTIDLIVGITLNALKAQATVTGGAQAKIPDSAIVEVNLLNPSDNKFSGWFPSIESYPFSVDAEISATVGAYLATALALKAEALGYGYEIELELRLPYFNGKFDYLVSPSGVCNSDKTMGVEASLNIGGQLLIDAKEVSSPDPIFSIQLGSNNFPLASTCWGFGPGVSEPTHAAASNPAVTTGSPASPTGGSCKQNDGTAGTCISTSACAAKGWKSEAGHCPGSADIQVRC
jgi:hypothetical protein